MKLSNFLLKDFFSEFKIDNKFIFSDCKKEVFLKKNAKKYEIEIVKKVLDANDSIADKMRNIFFKKKIYVINIMSSPGSGKTTFLQKVIPLLIPKFKCAVVVGDICTANDANRLAGSGIKVVQINTDSFGGDCHLGASTIEKAIQGIDIEEIDLLIIENIGNLVCPAEFDIGEDIKIAMLSVTEGEDKPAKYPLMFREAKCVILNKIDLLPYLCFDKKLAINTIRAINSEIPIFKISAKNEEGLLEWIDWLSKEIFLKIGLSGSK